MEAKREAREHGRRIQHSAGKIWGWASPAGELRVKRRIEIFLKHIDVAKPNRVLEIGCGTGIFSREFSRAGMAPIALDISFDLLQRAKEVNPGVTFVQADAENLPFKKGVFDYVIGISVLHHLSPPLALKNIKGVLKEGGTIVFSEPNMANPQIFLQRKIKCLRKHFHVTSTETAFFARQFRKTLAQNGFTDIVLYPFEFLHPLTPAFGIRPVKNLECLLERIAGIRELAGSLFISAKKRQ